MSSFDEHPVSRRTALARLGVVLGGAPALLRRRYRVFANATTEYSARCIQLMEASIVVDMLNQFRFQDFSEKPPRIDRWLKEPGSMTKADADVYLGSKMTAVALGHSPANYDDGIRFFAEWNGFLAAYSDWFTRVDDATDFSRAKRSNKLGVMLTFQN